MCTFFKLGLCLFSFKALLGGMSVLSSSLFCLINVKLPFHDKQEADKKRCTQLHARWTWALAVNHCGTPWINWECGRQLAVKDVRFVTQGSLVSFLPGPLCCFLWSSLLLQQRGGQDCLCDKLLLTKFTVGTAVPSSFAEFGQYLFWGKISWKTQAVVSGSIGFPWANYVLPPQKFKNYPIHPCKW